MWSFSAKAESFFSYDTILTDKMQYISIFHHVKVSWTLKSMHFT